MGRNPVFDQTYQFYLDRIAKHDLQGIAPKIGARFTENVCHIPLLGEEYRVSSTEIVDESGQRPTPADYILLAQYVLLHPETEPEEQQWKHYREFKDAAPFVGGFIANAELPISTAFSGRIASLEKACDILNGEDPKLNLPYDLIRLFYPLPKVPILLLFNDSDEEFPARCLQLFEERAQRYLDMECLAMLAWLLADKLIATAGMQEGILSEI